MSDLESFLSVSPPDVRAIRGVISDVGNVLLSLGERDGRLAWAERLGLPPVEFTEIVWEAIGSRGVARKTEIVARISDALGVDLEEAERALFDFNAHWQPQSELLTLLVSLRSKFKTAVLANAGRAARFGFEEILHLHTIVDSILISAELGTEKPSADAFLIAADSLKVAPAQCLFVDDRVENVEGARAVGMFAFQHTSPATTIEVLTAALALRDL